MVVHLCSYVLNALNYSMKTMRKVDVSGLERLCKAYGAITVGDKKWVWDYANDKPVPEEEMNFGSARHRESERARYGITTSNLTP